MKSFQFHYQEYEGIDELSDKLKDLVTSARQICTSAYAPYSNFNVGAAVLLGNGKVVVGVNIENAAYPVGICAERAALSSVLSQFPEEKIEAIAVSYFSDKGENTQPAFPCGMCRQFISECEDRNNEPIILLLTAMKGKVVQVNSAKHLLPFSFGRNDLT